MPAGRVYSHNPRRRKQAPHVAMPSVEAYQPRRAKARGRVSGVGVGEGEVVAVVVVVGVEVVSSLTGRDWGWMAASSDFRGSRSSSRCLGYLRRSEVGRAGRIEVKDV